MKRFVYFLFAFSIYNLATAQVQISGAMKNVMQKGDLTNRIHLDTLKNKTHLYGIGPLSQLKGELLILDGKAYRSSITSKGEILLEETFDSKAPFFVYANQKEWKSQALPTEVQTLKQLEDFIDQRAKDQTAPFVFRLKGTFKKVAHHIQNLPEGTKISSPKDAHTGQRQFHRENCTGEIVGFFSRNHQRIFTHHDSFMHLHFIDEKRSEMGHVDDLLFDSGQSVELLLPF